MLDTLYNGFNEEIYKTFSVNTTTDLSTHLPAKVKQSPIAGAIPKPPMRTFQIAALMPTRDRWYNDYTVPNGYFTQDRVNVVAPKNLSAV